MDTPSSAEIRIVRRKKGHGGHHGGSWKVAFADFMTAMMAFFLVMWIVGMDSNIKSAVEAYFKDPVAFKEAVSKGNAPFAVSASIIGGDSSASGEGDSSPSITVQISTDINELGALKSKIEKLISNTPEFKDLKKYIDVNLTNEGLQIELLEARKSMFFDSGSSLVKPKTRLLLLKLAKELKRVDNKMIVEGHTDSLPLRRSDGYSNWELSADRANGARKILEMGGIKHGQIVQVRGLADNDLRDPKHPESFMNRRVSILLLYNRSKTVSKKVAGDGVISLPEVKEIDNSAKKTKVSSEHEPSASSNSISETDKHLIRANEPDTAKAYSEAPVKTGDGNREITVVTREGKVYTVPSGDLTEGLIPKVDKKH